MSQDNIKEFVEIVVRNLEKNGFPGNAVSFSMERMYEEADKRGFSFNRVREALRERGCQSELKEDKVVFWQEEAQSGEADLYREAQEMLSKMSPDERDRIVKMVQQMDPATLEKMQREWEAMPPHEKAKLMKQMKNPS